MIEIYVDGACEPNPGQGGIGVSILENSKEVLAISKPIGKATNNVTEYKALIEGLKQAIKLGYQDVSFYTDSKLVACQFSKQWKPSKMPHLRVLLDEAFGLASRLKSVDIEWIPRHKNERADELSVQAVRGKKEEKGAEFDLPKPITSPITSDLMFPQDLITYIDGMEAELEAVKGKLRMLKKILKK